MIRNSSICAILVLLTSGCSSSSSSPSGSAEGGAGDAGATVADGGGNGGTDAGMGAMNGTVHVTYNLDNAGDKTFDCIVDSQRVFLHHTVAPEGSITLGCDDGSPGLMFTTVGVGVPDKVGTWNENQSSAVTFSQGTLQIQSPAQIQPASNPPAHTVTVTTWDLATEHAVGEANLPSFMSSGHTLTMKITFDVTTTEAK